MIIKNPITKQQETLSIKYYADASYMPKPKSQKYDLSVIEMIVWLIMIVLVFLGCSFCFTGVKHKDESSDEDQDENNDHYYNQNLNNGSGFYQGQIKQRQNFRSERSNASYNTPNRRFSGQ